MGSGTPRWSSMFAARWRIAALAASAAACNALPEVEYQTDHVELATDFEAPVCAGSLRLLERAAARIAGTFAPLNPDLRFRVYWLEHGLPDYCNDDTSGCYYPGTRVVYARGQSIAHELVHAALDSPGDGFFIEEGLAELYGGTTARFDPDHLGGRLDQQLQLTRRDYKHGQLSYPAAAHFAHWLRDEAGTGALQRLGGALSRGAGRNGLRDQLEGIFGLSIDEIEQRYRDEAPVSFAGIYDEDDDALRLDSSGKWFSIPLRCDSDDVVGPLPGAIAGMVRPLWLDVTESRTLRMSATGDDGTWVKLVDPNDTAVDDSPPWWPALADRPGLARLEPGTQASVTVDAGRYLLLFGTAGTEPRRVDLQFLR